MIVFVVVCEREAAHVSGDRLPCRWWFRDKNIIYVDIYFFYLSGSQAK